MSRRKRKRIRIHFQDDVAILDVGKAEIWDGGDLLTIRETLARLNEHNECCSVGVDMQFVRVIPSGFFGTLLDCHENGMAVRLYSPHTRVQNMLWFKKFCEEVSDGCFMLLSDLLGKALRERELAAEKPLATPDSVRYLGRLPEWDELW